MCTLCGAYTHANNWNAQNYGSTASERVRARTRFSFPALVSFQPTHIKRSYLRCERVECRRESTDLNVLRVQDALADLKIPMQYNVILCIVYRNNLIFVFTMIPWIDLNQFLLYYVQAIFVLLILSSKYGSLTDSVLRGETILYACYILTLVDYDFGYVNMCAAVHWVPNNELTHKMFVRFFSSACSCVRRLDSVHHHHHNFVIHIFFTKMFLLLDISSF